MSPPWLRQTAAGVELQLLVQPRASRDQLVGAQGAELKIRLAAPPVDGAANAACCAFFARLCGLSRSRVKLMAGESSRHKRLFLGGAEPAAVSAAIEAALGG